LNCQDHNDPLKNDEQAVLDESTMDGLKLMGAFGLQVPEKYGWNSMIFMYRNCVRLALNIISQL